MGDIAEMMRKLKQAEALASRSEYSPRRLYSTKTSPRRLPAIMNRSPARQKGHPTATRTRIFPALSADNGRTSQLQYFGPVGQEASTAMPILTSAAEGKKAAVTAWLDAGNSVDACASGVSLLLAACACGSTRVVELLLERGVRTDAAFEESGRRTALMVACDQLQPAIVSLLLGWGATSDMRDAQGQTALDQLHDASKVRVLDPIQFVALMKCARALTCHTARGSKRDKTAAAASSAKDVEDDPTDDTSDAQLTRWRNRQRRESRELAELFAENERRGAEYTQDLKDNHVKGRMLTDTITDARGLANREPLDAHTAATRLQAALRGLIARREMSGGGQPAPAGGAAVVQVGMLSVQAATA